MAAKWQTYKILVWPPTKMFLSGIPVLIYWIELKSWVCNATSLHILDDEIVFMGFSERGRR